jgi:NAD(P)-dependent dehydrogenase (short-subunit alcohol dehydrogenase family)
LIAVRDQDKGLKAREKLRRHGFDVHSTLLDVTDPMSIQAAVGRIKDEFERLDILVNNAGIMIDSQTGISELDLTIFQNTLETNVFGPPVVMPGLHFTDENQQLRPDR